MRKRIATKIVLFLAIFSAHYILIILVLSNVYIDQHPVIQIILGSTDIPGGRGQTLKRLSEAEHFGNVDILFLGSSHCYRGFDPRIIKTYGFTSFNLGTTAQTPTNSYFLLKHYFTILRPKVIVFEAYPIASSVDGLESFFDIVINARMSRELVEMAFALKNPVAMNFLFAVCANRIRRPLHAVNQESIPGEQYITGGYCEVKEHMPPIDLRIPPSRIDISEAQLDYLVRIINYCRKRKAFIVIVAHPLPKELVASIRNYEDVSRRLSETSAQNGAPYIDFGKILSLDTSSDFMDKDHLNASGVAKFNRCLMEQLSSRGYLLSRGVLDQEETASWSVCQSRHGR